MAQKNEISQPNFTSFSSSSPSNTTDEQNFFTNQNFDPKQASGQGNFSFQKNQNANQQGKYKTENTQNAVLVVDSLTKIYGKRIAVDSISFALAPGQIFGFLGANGAGKSTTIKMLTGLTSITSGNAYICGYSIKTQFEKAINNVGAIVEIPTFFPYLSGYNNLKYFAKLGGKVSPSRLNEVSSLVGLASRINDKVSTYSLGMKQRLGVAQALLHHPKLLILDEPTNGLDANGIREFRVILKTLAKKENICILISSHILAEMENLCDNIAIIDSGKLVEFKTLDEIKKASKLAGSQFIKCNAPNYAGKLIMQQLNIKTKISGQKVLVNADENLLAKIIVLLTSKRIQIFGAGEIENSLEDVFLDIVNKNHSSTAID